MAETRLSVHVYCRQCQTVRFLNYVYKCWEARQIYSYSDSEFQTGGELKADNFRHNASAVRGSESNNLSDDSNACAGR